MDKLELIFSREKETKNTIRYQEELGEEARRQNRGKKGSATLPNLKVDTREELAKININPGLCWLLFGPFSRSCPRCIRGFLLWDDQMGEAVCLNCGHRCYEAKHKRAVKGRIRAIR